jgi:4-hydroxybenzoate polyprenyltransferase
MMSVPAAGLPVRLGRFALERFPPVAYGLLVIALVAAGQAGAGLAAGTELELTAAAVIAAIAVTLGFFQLRILDELADERDDRIGRPDRPLPRGLVTRRELLGVAIVAAAVGTAAAAILGAAVLLGYGLALGQIWGLKVPAIQQALRRGGVLVNAIGHSLIVPSMLAVAWASTGPAPSTGQAPSTGALVATLVLGWGAGLALEIGRKTVAGPEERAGVETYSAAIGRSRAIGLAVLFLLVAGTAAAALAALAGAPAVVAATPVIVVLGVVTALRVTGARLGTRSLRGAVSGLVVAALLWPALLTLGIR